MAAAPPGPSRSKQQFSAYRNRRSLTQRRRSTSSRCVSASCRGRAAHARGRAERCDELGPANSFGCQKSVRMAARSVKDASRTRSTRSPATDSGGVTTSSFHGDPLLEFALGRARARLAFPTAVGLAFLGRRVGPPPAVGTRRNRRDHFGNGQCPAPWGRRVAATGMAGRGSRTCLLTRRRSVHCEEDQTCQI